VPPFPLTGQARWPRVPLAVVPVTTGGNIRE
jgi:hypothetical protein